MKLVRFLIGSLLVAGMLAVAPPTLADENGGGQALVRSPERIRGGLERGGQGWNLTCAHGSWKFETQMPACEYGSWNGKCYCDFNAPSGGDCEAT